jgi:prophage antirepressor-like protein
MSDITCITREFEGQPLHTYLHENRPCWLATEIGARLGYKHDGQRLVHKITHEWKGDLVPGQHIVVLTGAELETFTGALLAGGLQEPIPRASRALTLLLEPGLVYVLAHTPRTAGRELGRFIAGEVMPALSSAPETATESGDPPAVAGNAAGPNAAGAEPLDDGTGEVEDQDCKGDDRGRECSAGEAEARAVGDDGGPDEGEGDDDSLDDRGEGEDDDGGEGDDDPFAADLAFAEPDRATPRDARPTVLMLPEPSSRPIPLGVLAQRERRLLAQHELERARFRAESLHRTLSTLRDLGRVSDDLFHAGEVVVAELALGLDHAGPGSSLSGAGLSGILADLRRGAVTAQARGRLLASLGLRRDVIDLVEAVHRRERRRAGHRGSRSRGNRHEQGLHTGAEAGPGSPATRTDQR